MQAQDPGNDYWEIATLAEAALIMGEWDNARDCYSRAVKMAGHDYGSVHSMRRNARLLLKHLDPPPSQSQCDGIEGCFRVPNVVVFAGHNDGSARPPVATFPAEIGS